MSEVWNHFFMASNGLSVTCNHCGKFMKRSDSSTKSMWGHLKAFHADLVGEETFRLKRTRRMRGEGAAGGKSKKEGGGKAAKAKQQAAATEGAASSSASSSSSGGEEESEELQSSRATSRGSTPQLPPLSIQSLLKSDEKPPQNGEETPTQPYVKRKRVQQQQQQTEPDPHHQQPQLHEDGQPNSRRHSPVTTPPQQQNTSSQGSAFSKYSTAALIGAISQQQANNDASGGKKSPVHGAEAPRPAQKVQQLPAPRPKYGLEAITGLNAAQLAMLGVADPALLSNLEAAATMNHLMSECAKQRPTLPTPTAQQPNNNSPQLNELLALYASAAAASALQQQHGKAADQQQQMAAQQAAATAAASWIYNWEWLAAAQRNSALVANNKFATAQPNGKNANVAMMPLLSALNLGGGNPAALETRTAAAAKENSHSGANGALLGNKTSAFEQVPMKQAQNQREQQHGQKRKSPVEQEQHQLNNSSLLVLAEASTAAAAEQQQRMQQQNGGGASPPKRRTKEDPKENPQQQQQQQQQENQNALAESLVLYGMHRIAMELQLSYSVHANKLGKAEYAFYCTNAGMANANIQKMVTLTESTDQVLHIREYANGAVVAEECWPKSAEPGTLLLSLRDKCQRRLCAI